MFLIVKGQEPSPIDREYWKERVRLESLHRRQREFLGYKGPKKLSKHWERIAAQAEKEDTERQHRHALVSMIEAAKSLAAAGIR